MKPRKKAQSTNDDEIQTNPTKIRRRRRQQTFYSKKKEPDEFHAKRNSTYNRKILTKSLFTEPYKLMGISFWIHTHSHDEAKKETKQENNEKKQKPITQQRHQTCIEWFSLFAVVAFGLYCRVNCMNAAVMANSLCDRVWSIDSINLNFILDFLSYLLEITL